MHKTKAKPEPTNDAVGFPGGYLSAEERRAAGKALPDATPRAAHGGWKAPKDRRDRSRSSTNPTTAEFRS